MANDAGNPPESSNRATQPKPSRRSRFGPGLIIAASFIGPGTVTTATATGAGYGFALLWTIVFSILATIVLQEMSARLGLVSREGLGEALRSTFNNPVVRTVMVILVVSAIGIGGASYAGGDTTGTSIALTTLTGLPQPVVILIVGAVVALLLGTGTYKRVERVFAVLVAIMGAVFILTAVVVQPDLGAMAAGVFPPTIPDGALLVTIALIGTTVVPYNLFLHASLVQEKWDGVQTETAISEARRDTVVSISIGGIITIAILTTAAATLFVKGIDATSIDALAAQLEPVLGAAAQPVFALGLFSAGLTSAIAGPLGAAYAISSTLGWSTNLRDGKFKAIWATVLILGVVIALTGTNPIAVIVFAQAANGILLPIIAAFLMIVMNRKGFLGKYSNGVFTNVCGAIVLVVVTGLAVYQLADVFGFLPG